jgi:hypothetical protein
VKAKRHLFAGLGWVVWKALALVGIPLAKRKLEARARTTSSGA